MKGLRRLVVRMVLDLLLWDAQRRLYRSQEELEMVAGSWMGVFRSLSVLNQQCLTRVVPNRVCNYTTLSSLQGLGLRTDCTFPIGCLG